MEAIYDIPSRLKHVLRSISLAPFLAVVNKVSKKVYIMLLLIWSKEKSNSGHTEGANCRTTVMFPF